MNIYKCDRCGRVRDDGSRPNKMKLRETKGDYKSDDEIIRMDLCWRCTQNLKAFLSRQEDASHA